ncbi:methyl-accepting chemotaxis protein [Maritalea sp.]|uniref:methyl-accepting chemotaxis protein n=1 Tax=Maritalea sp. TaxID=2003361 RepID=UPI003EF3798F
MTFDQLRARGTQAISLVALVFAIAVAVVEYIVQGSPGLGTALGTTGVVFLAITFLWKKNSPTFRYLAVTVMMAEVMAILIATRGQPYQIDMHMAFFASLALCALLYDFRAILVGAVVVAVHHLGLGLTFDTLVFYGGGSLGRIVLHAVVLVVEAVALVWLTRNTTELFRLTEQKSEEVAQQAEQVREMSVEDVRKSEVAREERTLMLNELQMEFGEVVAAATNGDFSRRVRNNFEVDALNKLATDVNELVDEVEKGVSETGRVLSSLANADLTDRMNGNYRGAFDTLKRDTNRVADKLTDVIGQLQMTSGTLRAATGEILSGVSDLNERTSRQSITLQQTSNAMTDMAKTVAENASLAENARTSARAAHGTANQGSEVMEDANQAMGRITAASNKISDIISLIDDIAFQTNLLALNASVEAARAGEAGKGFAVVAVEVRRLAQSAAEASSDVKTLVKESSDEVSSGSKLVSQASDSLSGIVTAVREMTELMEAIAEQSHDQASSIDGVSSSMKQLEEMTQHNAALVEETNAAIEQTESQATELDKIVEVFNLVRHEPLNDTFHTQGNFAKQARAS